MHLVVCLMQTIVVNWFILDIALILLSPSSDLIISLVYVTYPSCMFMKLDHKLTIVLG